MSDSYGKIVKVVGGNEAKRVVIVKRPDGRYAIRPETWFEDCWLAGVAPELGIFADTDLATKEAIAAYPWLRECIST